VAQQYRAAAGPATAHGDALYVINETGYIRQAYDTDPGPSSSAVRSSFAVLFARAAQQALPQRALPQRALPQRALPQRALSQWH
jgi:hypothetical protein